MSEPTRVLAEGTLKYRGGRSGQWMTARVFVLDYTPSSLGIGPYVTVVAREPMFLPYHRIPSPVGSIHSMRACDESDLPEYEGEGELLTLDVDALVPA